VAQASDPVGFYAFVDKVVLEPNDAAPERIRIHGAFAFAQGSGMTYTTAERGYLYYARNSDKPEACRNEWANFKSLAGTGQIVAFAARCAEKGPLREPREKPGKPDLYPVNWGTGQGTAE
jgi:hypothetical protein